MAGKGGVWRGMRAGDLPAVSAIAAAVHPAYPESDAVFAERLRLFPRGCLLLESGGAAAGYALAHPWRRGRAVPLDSPLGALPEGADLLWLHDLALLPAARGGGAGGAAVRILAGAAGGRAMGLVALPGTEGFWSRQGFRRAGIPRGYGAGALLMERSDRTKAGPAGITRPGDTAR